VVMRQAGARSCRIEIMFLKLVMRISKNMPRRKERGNAFPRAVRAVCSYGLIIVQSRKLELILEARSWTEKAASILNGSNQVGHFTKNFF
jgi:hypothetical protein